MFDTVQSKVMLALAVPVIILSQREQFSMTKLFTHIFVYLSLAYNADCLVVGNCKLWAWGSLLFPLIQTIGYMFYTTELDVQPPVRFPTLRVTREAAEAAEATEAQQPVATETVEAYRSL